MGIDSTVNPGLINPSMTRRSQKVVSYKTAPPNKASNASRARDMYERIMKMDGIVTMTAWKSHELVVDQGHQGEGGLLGGSANSNI